MHNINIKVSVFSLLHAMCYGENKSTHKIWNNLHNIYISLCFLQFWNTIQVIIVKSFYVRHVPINIFFHISSTNFIFLLKEDKYIIIYMISKLKQYWLRDFTETNNRILTIRSASLSDSSSRSARKESARVACNQPKLSKIYIYIKYDHIYIFFGNKIKISQKQATINQKLK